MPPDENLLLLSLLLPPCLAKAQCKADILQSTLDIARLPAGIYQISLEGNKGKEIRRFVKM